LCTRGVVIVRAYRGNNYSVTSPHQAKQALREHLLAARRARPPGELEDARRAIRAQVMTRAPEFTVVAGYVPMRTEPGSVELLAELRDSGATVLVPVTLPDRDLDWAPWSPGGLGAQVGVATIARATLVLVPALAVAADGTRLGRGGGSYDRALARCPAGTLTVALLFDGELVDELPRDDWDVSVTSVVTPRGWFPVGRNTDHGLAR
jgi:5-formyltetrahydrofolate cyclo-ligase